MYQVVLGATADPGSGAEILFCGHHFRVSRTRLVARGAAVYDQSGWPVLLPS